MHSYGELNAMQFLNCVNLSNDSEIIDTQHYGDINSHLNEALVWTFNIEF